MVTGRKLRVFVSEGLCRFRGAAIMKLTAGQSVWLPSWRVMLMVRIWSEVHNPRDTVDGGEAPMSMSMASVRRADEYGKVFGRAGSLGLAQVKAQEQVALVE